jgi:hypothetical protein
VEQVVDQQLLQTPMPVVVKSLARPICLRQMLALVSPELVVVGRLG